MKITVDKEDLAKTIIMLLYCAIGDATGSSFHISELISLKKAMMSDINKKFLYLHVEAFDDLIKNTN